jgi:hypothetical protein
VPQNLASRPARIAHVVLDAAAAKCSTTLYEIQ